MTIHEMRNRKPTIGVLGIMQELYLPIHPGIKERQEKYARKVLQTLSDSVYFTFPGAAVNRGEIERYVESFNQQECDGILIIMLTYGASFHTYNAFKRNRLPIFLANIQPEMKVQHDWDMADLTYNQGIHGAQDTANALMWTGSKYRVWTGDWRDSAFAQALTEWANTAKTAASLSRLRIAQVGQMVGMGDIQANPSELLSRLGIQVDQTGIGLIHREVEKLSSKQIDSVVQENEQNFQIDPKLTKENHRYAASLQAAIETYMLQNGYSGISIYFNAPADDGRFRQLPLMAASNLMAKGYGYGGEGDTLSASLVTIGQLLHPHPSFTEMYAMDFSRGSILMSHMGEGNWKIARQDRPVLLRDRPLGIGGLDNPPTTVFSAQPGPATLATLVTRPEGGFRLIVSNGDILDTEEMENVEMPYYHFKPDSGIAACQNGWLQNGGSHHQCIHLGDTSEKWKIFCELTGSEYVQV